MSERRQNRPRSPIGPSSQEASARRCRRGGAYRWRPGRLAPFRDIARVVVLGRAARGWTQKQLADALGTTNTVVSRIESGRHAVSLDTLRRLAQALDVTFTIGSNESMLRYGGEVMPFSPSGIGRGGPRMEPLHTQSGDVAWRATVIAGSRVSVDTLFDCLVRGKTIDEFLKQFPTVSREKAVAILNLARAHVSGRGALGNQDIGEAQARADRAQVRRLVALTDVEREAFFLASNRNILQLLADARRSR